MINRISIINNILPIELANNIYNYCGKLKWSYSWPSNKKLSPYYHWNSALANDSVYNTLDISNSVEEPILEAWDYLQQNYVLEHKLIRCYANSYTYGTEGYPHKDSLREDDITTILYITKNWRREWAGETVVYDGNNIIQASLPEFNRGLILNSNIWHCARGVSRICSDLRTVLVFKSTPVNSDPLRDRLQIFLEKLGANKLPHNNSTLITHLLKTYDILKVAKQPEYICLAGGLHSIFGTTIYKETCLDSSYERLVIDFAGTKATELIKLFSTMNRPKLLEEYLSQSVKDELYDDLCLIEIANLYEQNNLKSYTKLTELWNNVIKPYIKQ